MIQFIAIDGKEVQDSFPEFYQEYTKFTSVYYQVSQKGKDLGYVVITKLAPQFCNLAFCSFEKNRHYFTKKAFLSVLDFPQQLGFEFCVILTKIPGLTRLLSKMKRYNVIPFGAENDYTIFIKDYELGKD